MNVRNDYKNDSRNNIRFNGVWLALFSIMVGYLIYFFLYSNISNSFIMDKQVEEFVGIFFMTACMSSIYFFLNFMLERKFPPIFRAILWMHYFILFLIVNFCLGVEESKFVLIPFDKNTYTNIQYLFMIVKSIALFLPIGYMIRKEDLNKTILFVILLILTIELAQYPLKSGIFDVNEIIFSFIGIYIGYFSFRKVKKKKER